MRSDFKRALLAVLGSALVAVAVFAIFPLSRESWFALFPEDRLRGLWELVKTRDSPSGRVVAVNLLEFRDDEIARLDVAVTVDGLLVMMGSNSVVAYNVTRESIEFLRRVLDEPEFPTYDTFTERFAGTLGEILPASFRFEGDDRLILESPEVLSDHPLIFRRVAEERSSTDEYFVLRRFPQGAFDYYVLPPR